MINLFVFDDSIKYEKPFVSAPLLCGNASVLRYFYQYLTCILSMMVRSCH